MVPFAGQDRAAVKCAGEQGREKRWCHVQGSKGEAMVPCAGEQGRSNGAICSGVRVEQQCHHLQGSEGEAMVPPFEGEQGRSNGATICRGAAKGEATVPPFAGLRGRSDGATICRGVTEKQWCYLQRREKQWCHHTQGSAEQWCHHFQRRAQSGGAIFRRGRSNIFRGWQSGGVLCRGARAEQRCPLQGSEGGANGNGAIICTGGGTVPSVAVEDGVIYRGGATVPFAGKDSAICSRGQ